MKRWNSHTVRGIVASTIAVAARTAASEAKSPPVDTDGIRYVGNDTEATYPHQPKPAPPAHPLLGDTDAGTDIAAAEKEAAEVGYVNPDRPKTLAESGDGPVPLDFKPGKHTEIIDHHVETADTFYPPGVPVPLEQILEHEARREHLRIYRNRPEKEDQLWVGGMPRFVRAPMHMVHGRDESRNMEMPPGPVLHDTKTGVALRILGSLTPSPEMVVQEAQIGAKLRLATSRWFFYGFLFVTAFFWKFVLYMQLRTKLRSQGIANPILPQNRIKVLEIMYFAREDFAQYKTLFAEFRDVQWIPYRQAKLRAETNMSESAASQLNQDLENLRKNKEAEAAPGWFASLFGGSKGEEEKKSTMAKVFVKELNKTFEVDTSRIVIGMGNAGPVYAPPDAEILQPDQLEEKMRTLKNKAASKLESEMKEWTATSYDDRARVSANEYVVQFHLFLQNKGVITPMDPEKVNQMYDLQSIPRIQSLDSHDGEGQASRAQIVRVK